MHVSVVRARIDRVIGLLGPPGVTPEWAPSRDTLDVALAELTDLRDGLSPPPARVAPPEEPVPLHAGPRPLADADRAVIATIWRRHPDSSPADVADRASTRLGREVSYSAAARYKPAELKRARRKPATTGEGT